MMRSISLIWRTHRPSKTSGSLPPTGVLVYAARSDSADAALETVERAMGGEVVTEKIRELLYCDLYEMRTAR